MTIKGVIFDLFHTLTGPESEWSDLPWTADVLGIDRRLWNDLLTQHSRWRLAGEQTDPYLIVSTLARQADPSIAEAAIRKALEIRTQRFRDSFSRIPPENVNTLRRLRAAGFKLGLISNADVMEAAPWSSSPLAGLFDGEIFSCAVRCVKPEPEIFEACLQTLGLSGDECLYVGDGGSDELAGARTAGMSPVFMSEVMAELWPERIPERLAQCDHHIRSIPEVLTLIGLH